MSINQPEPYYDDLGVPHCPGGCVPRCEECTRHWTDFQCWTNGSFADRCDKCPGCASSPVDIAIAQIELKEFV